VGVGHVLTCGGPAGKRGTEEVYLWGEESAPTQKGATAPHPFLPLRGLHVIQLASTALSTVALTGRIAHHRQHIAHLPVLTTSPSPHPAWPGLAQYS
jgi:hypothetical protein